MYGMITENLGGGEYRFERRTALPGGLWEFHSESGRAFEFNGRDDVPILTYVWLHRCDRDPGEFRFQYSECG